MERFIRLKECPYCFFQWAKKNGHTASGEQRYMCKRCDYQFTDKTAKEILIKCTKAHPYMRWRKKEIVAHEKEK